VISAAADWGRGRLIYLSVPRGLAGGRRAVPPVPRLFAHLTRGIMPVPGDVEWTVNKTDKGWLVTPPNPAGAVKPQQGVTPTDYRENRTATIRSRVVVAAASDRLLTADQLAVTSGPTPVVELTVQDGGVRIIELNRHRSPP
jgi:hypothetical protein